MKIEISELRNNTVWQLYRMSERIQLDPPYQRQGDIWTREKRQFLIDTILNDFDVPKLYLHKFSKPIKKRGKEYDYAIIDGKQRLEAVWKFIEGHYALSEEFSCFRDPTVDAKGMKYKELGPAYPDLKTQFDSFPFNVVCIETDDLDMIEEMFSRLNEAATLTAAEKRNAMGGPVPEAAKALAKDPFFTKRLPFENNRYRHLDLAVKFLLAESVGKIVDTKKIYLDDFVKDLKPRGRKAKLAFAPKCHAVLKKMSRVFQDDDVLLKNVGMVTLYYFLFHLAMSEGWAGRITRQKLARFELARKNNSELAERNLRKADYDLLEFDQYNQSPNDAYATRIRLGILMDRVFRRKVPKDF